MATHRLIQCVGNKVRPRKETKSCRKKYMWTAVGSSAGNFGRKGTQACPGCGTPPDFQHPINRYLNNEITGEEAQETLRRDYNSDWTKKESVGT